MKTALVLWLAVLTGPIIWMISFGANFALVPWACTLKWKPALYAVSTLAFAISAGSAYVAWHEWRRLGRELPGEAGGAIPRSRALASGGVVLSVMFALVITSQAIVEVILGACE